MSQGEKKPGQHAEKRIYVERIEIRIKKPVSTPRKEPPWQGVRKGRKPGQHAEKKTSVARSEKRAKTRSARREKNLRGKE